MSSFLPSDTRLAPRSQPQPGHLYSTAIVGAGLAGSELALRLAQAGEDVLLVTQALDHIGNLYAPTLAGVKFPPETRLGRLQAELPGDADTWAFHRRLKTELEGTGGLHLLQSTVTAVRQEEEDAADAAAGGVKVVQLSTWEGPPLRARRAVLAAGAFLHGRLHVGETVEEAGRLSEVAYDLLADDLQRQGLILAPAAQEAAPVQGAPAYRVTFSTLADHELDGFQLRRLPAVYAVGRCTPQGQSYGAVLEGAAALARLLAGEGAA